MYPQQQPQYSNNQPHHVLNHPGYVRNHQGGGHMPPPAGPLPPISSLQGGQRHAYGQQVRHPQGMPLIFCFQRARQITSF